MLAEAREQVARVVRTGACLRVVLHAEDRLAGDGDAFIRVIEQVLVRDAHAGRQRALVDDEPVVLRRDLDLAGRLVEHRMIAAVMAEAELQRLRAEREPEDLVAEADAEHRLAARHQFLARRDAVRHRRRIARAVREEEAVRAERERFFRRRRRGDDGDARADVAELAKDVLLHAEVVRDDVELDGRDLDRAAVVLGAPRRLVPLVALGAGDARDEIEAVHRGSGAHAGEHGVDLIDMRRDRAVLRALIAERACQRAGIDAVDAGDLGLIEPRRQRALGAPRCRQRWQLADRETGARDARGLDVLAIDADVPDLGRRHHDDLPAVRWVADDLLIAGDRRVEHDLADRLDLRAEAFAAEHLARGKHECRRPARGLGHFILPSRSKTGRPSSSVSTARPASFWPTNGEFFDLLASPSALNVTGRSGSMTVMSAIAPTASAPPGKPTARAGPPVSAAIARRSSSVPMRTKSRMIGNAVSRPSMPGAAHSNSTSFSTGECGAWSVAIASITPSASASSSAS